MYVRAKNSFNHGGIIEMVLGDCKTIDDSLAKTLIGLDVVVQTNPHSYKKIKIKKSDAKSVDQALNTDK